MPTRTRRLRRQFDIVVSLIALVALWPLLVLISLAVWLDDGRPILYHARRVGRGGQIFHMYKFRTMIRGAHNSGPALTVAGDVRVSRAGRFLRRIGADELPQLFNVLRGEMSLVGPRPEDPRYVALYSKAQQQVLRVRPGIIGVASLAYRHEQQLLSGPDWESRYINEIMPAKLNLELAYLERPSIYSDLLLILRASGVVLLKR